MERAQAGRYRPSSGVALPGIQGDTQEGTDPSEFPSPQRQAPRRSELHRGVNTVISRMPGIE